MFLGVPRLFPPVEISQDFRDYLQKIPSNQQMTGWPCEIIGRETRRQAADMTVARLGEGRQLPSPLAAGSLDSKLPPITGPYAPAGTSSGEG